MPDRLRQIPLALPVVERRGREDWIVSTSNTAATDLVERWPDWPSDVVLLIGPRGSGKSHLARVFADLSGAILVAAADLATRDPLDLAAHEALVVEDAGEGVDERALFHLLNAVRQSGATLLITARAHPALWGLTLPDLLSRLRAATPVELAEPDDELLAALLAKLFADRQTVVDPAVISYVARRMERSFAAAVGLVEALDRTALAAKGPITRAVAARVLDGGFDAAPRLPGLDARAESANNPS